MRARPDLTTAQWRKSSYSNPDGGNCIEVADGHPGMIPVRDSKVPSGAVLLVDPTAWSDFVAYVGAPGWRKSSYSNGDGGQCVEVADQHPGVVLVRDSKAPTGPVLVLSPAAWVGFLTYAQV
ncbi:DUF397 domain-containing protein [Streptomyces niveus]|uniref:DUF397 domain-containing protein n=1 Tax=Streptomyces niveus TaxID=193462 RepID=UPI003437CC3B